MVREIAESAKKEMNMIKKKPPIEIKVVYRFLYSILILRLICKKKLSFYFEF